MATERIERLVRTWVATGRDEEIDATVVGKPDIHFHTIR